MTKDKTGFVGVLGELNLEEFLNDEDGDVRNEWYRALKVPPPKPGSLWIAYGTRTSSFFYVIVIFRFRPLTLHPRSPWINLRVGWTDNYGSNGKWNNFVELFSVRTFPNTFTINSEPTSFEAME